MKRITQSQCLCITNYSVRLHHVQFQMLLLSPNRGANEKPYCVKLTSANMRMHYELLPCEKLHYEAHQGLIELSAPTLRCRGECSEMSRFLPEASLKQGGDSNGSDRGFRSVRFKMYYHRESLEFNVDSEENNKSSSQLDLNSNVISFGAYVWNCFFFFFTEVTTPLKVFFYSNCIIHSFQYVIKKKKGYSNALNLNTGVTKQNKPDD